MPDLYNKIDKSKQDIFCNLAECMIQVKNILEQLKEPYSPELVELLCNLEPFQYDLNFAYNEGKALGKYFKSRGYTEEYVQQMLTGLHSAFN